MHMWWCPIFLLLAKIYGRWNAMILPGVLNGSKMTTLFISVTFTTQKSYETCKEHHCNTVQYYCRFFQKAIKVSRLNCIQYSMIQYLTLGPFFAPRLPFFKELSKGFPLLFHTVFVQNRWHDSLSQAALQRLSKRGIWRVGGHWMQLINYTGNSHVIKCIRISLLSLPFRNWEHWKKHNG